MVITKSLMLGALLATGPAAVPRGEGLPSKRTNPKKLPACLGSKHERPHRPSFLVINHLSKSKARTLWLAFFVSRESLKWTEETYSKKYSSKTTTCAISTSGSLHQNLFETLVTCAKSVSQELCIRILLGSACTNSILRE